MGKCGLGGAAEPPRTLKGGGKPALQRSVEQQQTYFQVPLHYPRYTKVDYENMPEWRLDCLLAEYGLPVSGTLEEKRKFAMGASFGLNISGSGQGNREGVRRHISSNKEEEYGIYHELPLLIPNRTGLGPASVLLLPEPTCFLLLQLLYLNRVGLDPGLDSGPDLVWTEPITEVDPGKSLKEKMSATSYANGVCSTVHGLRPDGQHQPHQGMSKSKQQNFCFQMPLHYPRYSKREYETMPEWKLDHLLMEYGLPTGGDVDQKRKFAMGTFLWPSQIE
ncbi:hypothetical protein Ancab_032783 [Ancistrocladus abbreviatus]